MVHELSIFIDESGDFGAYESHAPYYIIALVLHSQDEPITEELAYLARHVMECGFKEGHAIHTGPLIRREADYASLEISERKKLFRVLFNFTRRVPISFRTFLFKKKEFHGNHDALVSRMSREISSYVKANMEHFQSFQRIVVYYDNGQKEITNIINTVLNTLL